MRDEATGELIATAPARRTREFEITLVDGPRIRFAFVRGYEGPHIGFTEDNRIAMTLWFERTGRGGVYIPKGVTHVVLGSIDLGDKTTPAIALACNAYAPRPEGGG